MSATIRSLVDAVLDRTPKATSGTDALAGLDVLDASHLPRWKRALAAAESSGYGCYFPFVLAHQRPGRSTVLVGEDSGSLCLFIRRDGREGSQLDVFLNPIPMDVDVARRCLERANDFNHDRSARILRIDGSDAALAARVPGLRVRERRKQYVYDPGAFGDLSGGKYRTLRYQVAKVRRIEDLEVVPYAEAHAGACRALLERWAERHRSMFGTSGDAGMSRRALALTGVLGAPDLAGEVVLLGGAVVGFAFGGELRPGLGCLFEVKTDLAVPGLSHFQFHSFLAKPRGFERINGGSDARRPGLRQLKDSLRPASMYVEYRGTQVAP